MEKGIQKDDLLDLLYFIKWIQKTSKYNKKWAFYTPFDHVKS
jgi:hypothetical protein